MENEISGKFPPMALKFRTRMAAKDIVKLWNLRTFLVYLDLAALLVLLLGEPHALECAQ